MAEAVSSALRAEVSPALGGARDFCPLPHTPIPASPSNLRFAAENLLDEAEHFLHKSRCQRRYAPRVFGFIPECRSASFRNQRSASPGSSLPDSRESEELRIEQEALDFDRQHARHKIGTTQ
jgi:hypothetical protein